MRKYLVLIVLSISFAAFSQAPLKVMTYNIKFDDKNDMVNGWSIRKDELVGLIQYHQPVIIGTQEGLKNQLDYMKEHLDGFNYFGVARDDGKEKGEYTAIFYNTQILNLVQQQSFWLSTTSDKPSKDWDAALPRICTWAQMEVRSTGLRFYIFNTHFDHVGVEARKNSMSLILKKIKQIADDSPVILMGDFNFEPDKEPYALATAMLADTREISKSSPYGPQATFNGFAFEKRPDRRIDFIFVNRNFQVLNYAVLSDSRDKRYPSDHFPVVATLDFSR